MGRFDIIWVSKYYSPSKLFFNTMSEGFLLDKLTKDYSGIQP